MNRLKFLTFISIALFAIACTPTLVSTQEESKEVESKADLLLQETLEAHGGELYNQAHYSFIFREKEYQFKNNGSEYTYRKAQLKDGKKIEDQLKNGELSRIVDGQETRLNEKEINSYSNVLNSVIYFATLPHKLTDAAVNKKYIGTTNIKGAGYEIMEVTFEQEGGGKDHDDQYYYWINQSSKKIDYLAYNYKVNKGGVRFREAFNSRVVDGITFQDYINYKAPVGTPLSELPQLLEKGELVELSRIITEDVKSLK